jgi:hypothetical protein
VLTALQGGGVKPCRGCEAKGYLLSINGKVKRKRDKRNLLLSK